MVFDPARHTALHGEPWSRGAATGAIEAIVRDFEEALQPDGLWPTHPLDDADRRPRRCAYFGAAGAVTALRILRATGYEAPDRSELCLGHLAGHRAEPDVGPEDGLQLGEVGILVSAALSAPGDGVLVDALAAAAERTIEHPAQEITSGGTGSLFAARALLQATGAPRWRDLVARLVDALFGSWEPQDDTGTWLWRHEIFGGMRRYFGANHGVAGNAGALALACRDLGDDRGAEALRRAANALEAGALREAGEIGWPVSPDADGTRRLVQWCHGAPGVITALAKAPGADEETGKRLDALLLPAGHTVWSAGPVRKGVGLCHGTAGNGYAFLFLFARTGDGLWLDRARAFAMHAIAQRERHRARFGQGRYTLWTGDGGLAVFLHHCIDPSATAFPGLELF